MEKQSCLTKKKLYRISTVPMSLNLLLQGQLKFLNQFYKVVGISDFGKDLNEVQNREGIETRVVGMKREISILKDFISLVKLSLLFRKEKPFIVHTITPKAGLLSMIAAKITGVPIRMHTFTGLIFPSKSGLMQKLLVKMDQLLCCAATNIYPEGEGVKNDLLKYKITKKPLKILANGNVNGIDVSHFNPALFSEEKKDKFRYKLSMCKEDFVFIFIGRLVKDKGINELVSAFSKLKTQNCKLLLVGPKEQDLYPLLPETLHEVETNENIVYVGYQDDVRPYLAIADALVFPSYREGFPNVVIQAGAMGLPSIVTDINGSNEIIIEGKNGKIIPSKDENALLRDMKYFIENPEEVKHMANESRPLIVSRYEQKMVWGALLKEYKRLETEYENRKDHVQTLF